VFYTVLCELRLIIIACALGEGVVGFQPKKKGSYSIEVTQEGKAIPGSPFRIEVGDGQLCQASKVHVTGASKEATAMKWNDVHIKIADAGTYDKNTDLCGKGQWGRSPGLC